MLNAVLEADLVKATKTTRGWRIQPGARRQWMDGRMAIEWQRTEIVLRWSLVVT
jgi:hypothetical protein